MATRDNEDAAYWASRAPQVPEDWFLRRSNLHGVRHTQRVHVHVQRITAQLGWNAADRELVLHAALWHDIGRLSDGVEPSHGAGSAARAKRLGLTAALSSGDAAVALFAVELHSLPDDGAAARAAQLASSPPEPPRLADPERALRVLWLLKDADALDRIRLGVHEHTDPRQLRHPQAVALIGFAEALYRAFG